MINPSICKIPDCNKKVTSTNKICSSHRVQKFIYGTYEPLTAEQKKKCGKKCKISDCNNPLSTLSLLCATHRGRYQRHKSFDPPPKIDKLKKLPPGIFKICKVHGERTKEEVRLNSNNVYLCLLCQKIRNKHYNKLYSKKKRQEKNFKHKYGITLEEFENQKIIQKNLCAICQSPETAICHRTKRIRNLSVDHCHKTGKIRKLLCRRCNQTLGLVQENTRTLSKMIEYLLQYS